LSGWRGSLAIGFGTPDGNQLLELAFDVGIAQVRVFDHAIRIDGERSRDSVDLEAFRNRTALLAD
jgi:hypothetical protein